MATLADYPVAQEIHRQLGGRMFNVMIGRFHMSATKTSITVGFKARALKKIKYVRVELTPADTYTVEFMKIQGFEMKIVSRHEDIYCDQLKELFERNTGLYTRL